MMSDKEVMPEGVEETSVLPLPWARRLMMPFATTGTEESPVISVPISVSGEDTLEN